MYYGSQFKQLARFSLYLAQLSMQPEAIKIPVTHEVVQNKHYLCEWEISPHDSVYRFRLEWRSPSIDRADLQELCRTFVQYHKELMTRAKKPTLLEFHFPENTSNSEVSRFTSLTNIIGSVPNFLEFRNYLVSQGIGVALIRPAWTPSGVFLAEMLVKYFYRTAFMVNDAQQAVISFHRQARIEL